MRRRHKKILLKFTAAMTTVAVFYCQVVHAYAMPLVSDPPPFPRDVGAAAQYVDNESGHFVEISV
ncbi:MAG: hypothetical protein HYS56_03250, partial [Candidatus Omnitrophica bacterium]|nr:hypothetical protein [Candidatus Omnitrophota bacterium]